MQTPASASPRSARSWRSAWFGRERDSQVKFRPPAEKVRLPVLPTRAVIETPNWREWADDRYRACPAGGAEDDADPRPETAVAGPLRDRAAALQQAVPRKPTRVQNSGVGLWRPQARDHRAARGP